MQKGYPLGATVLGAVGAMLIVLEGVSLTSPSGPFMPTNWPVFALGLSVSTTALAIFSIVLGSLGLAFTLLVYLWPDAHTFSGIGAITIALLSLFSGGGFLLGALLLWLGGVLAIYFGLRTSFPEEMARPPDRFVDAATPGPMGPPPHSSVTSAGQVDK